MEICFYMFLGVLIYMLGEGKVKLPSITNLFHELLRRRYGDVPVDVPKDVLNTSTNNSEDTMNTSKESLNAMNTSTIAPEVPVERESEWEKEYNLRMANLREELANVHSSKTPPNFFDYDEQEMLKSLDKNVEIITDRWEREQEERIMHL